MYEEPFAQQLFTEYHHRGVTFRLIGLAHPEAASLSHTDPTRARQLPPPGFNGNLI